jgi:hypothetical protein
MAKITYEDKVALNPQPSIANVNKVSDADMNEIKSVVNENAVETGSNANGSWIKYENGIMICWGQASPTFGAWSASGSIYSCKSNPTNFLFAQEFYDLPAVSLTHLPNTEGYWECWFGRAIWDKTGVTFIQIFRPNTGNTGIAFAFRYIAIGRWK